MLGLSSPYLSLGASHTWLIAAAGWFDEFACNATMVSPLSPHCLALLRQKARIVILPRRKRCVVRVNLVVALCRYSRPLPLWQSLDWTLFVPGRHGKHLFLRKHNGTGVMATRRQITCFVSPKHTRGVCECSTRPSLKEPLELVTYIFPCKVVPLFGK